VLAWRRKLLGRRSPDPITDPVRDLPRMQSITLPNPKQTIYGRAAEQWLKAKALWAPLQDKLKIVQTVPQVSAYLTTGQIDAGFLSLTEVLAFKGQLGGYIELRPGADSYAPIDIVAVFRQPQRSRTPPPSAPGLRSSCRRPRRSRFCARPGCERRLIQNPLKETPGRPKFS